MNKYTQEQLYQLRRRNNPYNEPVGDYTGRCKRCGSTNLWDDDTAYGCNTCGAIFFTGGEVRLIRDQSYNNAYNRAGYKDDDYYD